MKKIHESDKFQYESAFVRADLLLSRPISVEAIAIFLAGIVIRCKKRLAVLIASDDYLPISRDRSRLVDIFYTQCQKAIDRIPHHCLDFTVRFSYSGITAEWCELVPSIRSDEVIGHPQYSIVKFPQVMPLMIFEPLPPIGKTFKKVLFAGTFDHLHSGHKSILTQAVFLAEDTLYIAVTSEQLLANKKCRAAIDSFDLRIVNVDNFIRSLLPECKKDLEIVILETPDVIGPAGYLEFDALIVTPETIRGGEKVNEARINSDRPPVEIIVLGILDRMPTETKLSSTNVRTYLCDKLTGGESDLDRLHAAFISGICRQIMSEEEVKTIGTTWWSRLRDMYGLEPWRHYHTLRHVNELLEGAKAHYGSFDQIPVNVNLAIWFHDCVYDPRSTKNEEDSVKVFEDFAKCIKAFPNELVDEARIAILLSKDHVRALKDMSTPEWMRVFLELDLSILASDSTRYAEYKTQIRQEYFHLADEAFRSGRRRFLEGVSNFRFMNVSNKDVLNTAFAKNIEVEISELS